jgi:hypothetical protein
MTSPQFPLYSRVWEPGEIAYGSSLLSRGTVAVKGSMGDREAMMPPQEDREEDGELREMEDTAECHAIAPG